MTTVLSTETDASDLGSVATSLQIENSVFIQFGQKRIFFLKPKSQSCFINNMAGIYVAVFNIFKAL